ncbi:Helix-turn-helix domain protein [Polystyrenella longa]|uniref:Helix-turn-helix domain protein n=1 Tax=Polystyrenella longa TaxID=2528007 RepID=A0A518CK64_9PLAN|nr:helix-turn-helix domain-containing protein [Polystyrenella longa]QDU79616.1 Helix-turn-helix domain protein [Polystyrenella longa]
MSKTNGTSKDSEEPKSAGQLSQLTPKQVARAMGVSESSVKRWCDAGEIVSTLTAGGHRRLSHESVQQFLRNNNHLDVDPDIFSLNFSFGKSDRALHRGKENFAEALLDGSEARLRQIVTDYLQAGHKPALIFDQILFAARAEVRKMIEDKQVDPYVDRLGTEICLRLMFEIRSNFLPPDSNSPSALTVGLDGSPDSLRVEAAEVLLYHEGWNARAIGCLIPFAQLKLLLQQHEPGLVYIDVEQIRDSSSFFHELSQVQQVAQQVGTALFIGGTANFDGEQVKQLSLSLVDCYDELVTQTRMELNRLKSV